MPIDEATSDQVIKRLHRVEGQIAGIVRMIEAGRECDEVVIQLSAASRALSRAGFKIVCSGMRQCLGASGNEDPEAPSLNVELMEKLFLSLA
ncbi:MAG: metal-sensitive transcriptional regulator [Acidimicrobiales bacterium]